MKFKKSRTCVVVLTWNRLKELKKTLRSFKTLNPVVDHKDIIIVDNGSTDGTLEWLSPKGHKYVRLSKNTGAQSGKFKGWEQGYLQGYDFIIFLEDDFPCTHKVPIKLLEDYLDKNPTVGYVRLNDKKYTKVNWITKDSVVYHAKDSLVLGSKYTIQQSNYHFTSNPMIFRVDLVPQMAACLVPDKIVRPKLNKIAHYQGVRFEYISELARERLYKEFGKTEKTYMQLYLYKYAHQAQLFPYCFKTQLVKRRKDWKN